MKKEKTHGIALMVRAIVRDPDGKIITDTGRKRARSFLIQFLEFIYFSMRAAANGTATATDGSEDLMYDEDQGASFHLRVDAGVNDSTYGVVVGTGDAAEANTNYKLETQLTEGVGAGNITHNESVIETTAEVGANVDLEVKRSFTNGTGSTITVKEAGIYTTFTRSGPYFHCIIRDVLAASVDVPDKCSLTIIYTLRTTV